MAMKKLNSWVIYSSIAFTACIINFSIWIKFGNGEQNLSLWLGIITFIIWGCATSKGFEIGLFKDN